MERPTPPWMNEIPEGAFVSYDPTYPTGKYFDRFKKDSSAGMKYYYYDPTEHGFPERSDYPLLIFLHGTSNALVGDLCINYTGAEMYSSDSYQETLGGAYILIPVANEYRDEEGRVCGFWDESYCEPVLELIDDFVEKHMKGLGVKFLLGNSSGGRFTFTLAKHSPDKFDVLIPVGTCDIPDDDMLDTFVKEDVTLFFADGKRDEITRFEENVAPRIPKMESMKNSFMFTPEWVYNGDKGIASINFGYEMGQHCLMNGIQMNLMFDDGTPVDDRLPNGVTGWMADEIKRRAEEK